MSQNRMVPISVTGVHNCLSNCFITGEEAWAPSALFHHIWILGSPLLSFNMYLLAAMISQEHVIYLYANSDSNAFNGNSHGRWGWSAYGNLLMAWMNVKRPKIKKHGDFNLVLKWSTKCLSSLSLSVFVFYPLYDQKTLEIPSRDLLS